MTRFERDGLEYGLRQLVARLHAAGGDRAGVRIVGGAALALRHFERESTVGIDAHPIGDADQAQNTEPPRSPGRRFTTTITSSSKLPQLKRCSL
jgi:hypothetical protein